ncbi:MAG: histidine phosphatase family protein [Planctomycetota bacterium]|nr:MAG: histidine phosphatase family protein [Planctomycetota bacterium]
MGMASVPNNRIDEQQCLRQARVLLVRHGQPLDTPPRSFLGHSNPSLAESGWQQARYAGRLLRQLWDQALIPPATQLWHSDLARAQQTACACMEYAPAMSMRADSGLREIDFGSWDCRTFAEINAEAPGSVEAWFANPMDSTPAGGESLQAVYERVRSALLRIIQGVAPTESVVIVAHYGSLAMAAGCLLGLTPPQALGVTLRRGCCGFIDRGALQWWGRGHDQ